jgi:tape measure domain-containing protein
MASKIRVELELADGGFSQRIVRAGQSVREFNQEVSNSNPRLAALAANGIQAVRAISLADGASKSFAATLRDVAIVTGIVSVAIGKVANIQSSWIGDIVRTNMEFERLNFQMRSMSTAADPVKEAADNVRFLRESAKNMPFQIATINSAFVKLKATGTDPLNGSLKALADGVAAFGGTDEALDRVVLGISQMSGKGVIQMEELRQQLGEQMPTAVQVMARAMGVSMSQLIKDIGTGTLGAKQSLDLFYQELNRSYGGRALYMMQTFEGQLKRVGTQLQLLALEAGGMQDGSYVAGGFMDTLRQQLRDLNDVLSSAQGAAMAQGIGSGLTAVVRGLRTAIDFLIEFRNEAGRMAIAIATAFTFRAAISGIGSLGAAIGNLVQGIKTFQLAAAAAAAAGTDFVTMARAMQRVGDTGAVMRSGLIAVRSAIGTLAIGMATVAPWLTAIGLGAYAAAEYFGVFENKVETAYETLKKFGAESRRQAKEITDARIAQLEEELAAERERVAEEKADGNSAEEYFSFSTGTGAGLLRRLAQLKEEQKRLIEEAGRTEDEKITRKYIQGLDDRWQARQNQYVREQLADQEHYDKLEAEEAKAGKSVEKLREERGKSLLNRARQFHEWEIGQLQAAIAEQQKLMRDSVDPIVDGQARQIIDALNPRLLEAMKNLQKVREQVAGTPLLPGAVDDQKKFEKGKQYLLELQAEAGGLKASLTGANAEVLELQEVLTRSMKFGHIDTTEVQNLIRDILKAKAEKELLDELMSGKKKLDNDIERARMDAIEKRMELQERAADEELSQTERIRLRMQNGYYQGFGPASLTQQWLLNLLKTFDAQGVALSQIANVLQQNTFGQTTVARINTTADALQRIVDQVSSLGTGLNGINWSALNPGFGVPGMIATGVKALAGSSFVDKVVGQESGGVADAKNPNSSATGLGQFIKSTWMEFLKDVYPAIAAGPRQEALELRKDESMSREAIGWLAGKNAEQLAAAGKMVNDANLYLAHLLGPQGAIKTLSAHPDQLLSGVLDQGTMSANGFLQGKTVAWLKSWAEQKFGTANTSGLGPAGSALPTYTPSQAAVEIQAEMNRLQDGFIKQLEEIGIIEKQNEAEDKRLTAVERRKELVAQLEAEKEAFQDLDGSQKNYLATRKLLEKNHIDLGSKEAKEALAAAKELDALQTDNAKRKKTLTEINNDEERFAQRRIELARQAKEAHAQMLDPLEIRSSAAFRALQSQLEEYIRNVEEFYGRDSDEYRRALADKAQMLRTQNATEASEFFTKLNKETRERQRSLMTQRQQRQIVMQEQLAQIDAWADRARKAGMDEVEITRQVEQAKKAIRDQYQAQVNPLSQQMKEWADLQGNLAQASTQWMSSLADGVTNLIMGTGDLRSMINGILKDMVNMGVKYLMSQFMGAKGGGASGAGKAASAAGKAGKGGNWTSFATIVGAAHTGAIAGGRMQMHRRVNPGVFFNAPRFHTGGIIGSDEVPILAKRKEGVFTPEQMKAMGGLGGQHIKIEAPITVNGSAGTPAQNADLAKQLGSQLEETMRGVVADEIRRQTRPGNMLNTR